MKKIALFLVFITLLCVSGCRGESPKSKPSSGNVFIYTTVIDIFTLDDVFFLDFESGNFYIDFGADKRFIGAYNLENRKTENITNIIGLHTENFLSDGENGYYIEKGDGYADLICLNSAGEKTSIPLIIESIEEDFYVSPDIDYSLYKSGGYIISIGRNENWFSFTFYNPKTKEIFTGARNSLAENQDFTAVNGFITYVQEKDERYTLFAIEPEKPNEFIRGPVSKSEIVFSAYDGENFIWSSSDGLFITKNGKSKLIDNYCGKFAVLAENFVIWPDEDKIGLYRIDMDYTGGYSGFSDLETVYADEDIIVFENGNPSLGEKYLSYTVKRSEEPDRKGLEAEASVGPYTIAVDGYLYYCYLENSKITPEENQIIGKITSVYDDITTCPRRNNQTNIPDFLGMRYALVDGEILLEGILGTENKPVTVWYKCKQGWAFDEMNIPE